MNRKTREEQEREFVEVVKEFMEAGLFRGTPQERKAQEEWLRLHGVLNSQQLVETVR